MCRLSQPASRLPARFQELRHSPRQFHGDLHVYISATIKWIKSTSAH